MVAECLFASLLALLVLTFQWGLSWRAEAKVDRRSCDLYFEACDQWRQQFIQARDMNEKLTNHIMSGNNPFVAAELARMQKQDEGIDPEETQKVKVPPQPLTPRQFAETDPDALSNSMFLDETAFDG